MKGKIDTYKESLKEYVPNFFSGIFSVFASGNRQGLYEWFLNRNESDGLYSDWCAIGNDLQVAMNNFESQQLCQSK